MWRRIPHIASALLAGLLASPLAAAPDLDDVDLKVERAAIEEFQAVDQRLQDIGWQLARANAEFCQNSIPSIGLQLQDLASYGAPEIARAALDLTGDFAVQTAARGSPAYLSGAFAPNHEVTRLGSVDPNGWEAGKRLHWERLARAHDHIDAELAANGAITLTFADQSEVEVAPVKVCASRFVLATGTDKVRANGKRVLVGIETPAVAYPEELFAALVAHELAHNVLAHSDWLDRNTRKRRNVRLIEREADRLMPWLLVNAGYDPRAAIRFFKEYRPSSGSVLFIPGTHDKWQARAAMIEAELAAISPLIASEGKADWSLHFLREIDPDAGVKAPRGE
ncbi:MAG: hypothetical protein AAF941_00045 [Pseudomonadota bacterium]